MASSFSSCVACKIEVATRYGRSKGSRVTGFNFLCFPTSGAAFHLERTTVASPGRRATYLLAFPNQQGSGMAIGCSIGFAPGEDLVEEAVLHEV